MKKSRKEILEENFKTLSNIFSKEDGVEFRKTKKNIIIFIGESLSVPIGLSVNSTVYTEMELKKRANEIIVKNRYKARD